MCNFKSDMHFRLKESQESSGMSQQCRDTVNNFGKTLVGGKDKLVSIYNFPFNLNQVPYLVQYMWQLSTCAVHVDQDA